MEYNLKDHGDHLEKNYSDFIQTHFRTYEEVWKLFIGNKGNDTKADIEGYPIEKDIQRQNFSEHTYTILQSLILLKRLIDKEVFDKSYLNTTNDILDLQDSLLLFFTHLGRIRDNVKEASKILNIDPSETTNILEEFYHKRHLFVHGRTLPIIFKANGEILLPVLSKNNTDITGWYDKEHSWKDIVKLPTEKLDATAKILYWELLSKLVEVFGKFKKQIEKELDDKYHIKFENKVYIGVNRHGSGSIAPNAVSVYGIKNINPKKW